MSSTTMQPLVIARATAAAIQLGLSAEGSVEKRNFNM